MNKSNLLLSLLLALTSVASAQQLSWAFSNPQLVNGDNELQFDVEVKCDQSGTYLRDMQVYVNYNPAAFGYLVAWNGNVSSTRIGIMDDPGVPGNPYSPLYGIVNMIDNTSTRFAILTATNYSSKYGGETNSFLGVNFPYNLEVPTDWVGFLRFNLVISDPSQQAGITFAEDLMSGGQYYTPPGNTTAVPYVDPDLFFNNSLDHPLLPQPTTTWTGAVDDDWYNADNWSGAIPAVQVDAVIPDVSKAPQPVISDGTASVNNLQISSGASLEIGDLANLTCYGSFTNDGSLTIRAGVNGTGSFIDSGDISGTGSEVVERYAPSFDWHLISAPISNGTIAMYETNYLQEFDESTEAWTYLVLPLSIPLTPMQGYALWSVGPDNISFDGRLNTGNISYSCTNDMNGWNLTGNPYPSSIDWNLVTKDNLDGAMWKYDPQIGDYLYYLAGAGVLNTTDDQIAVGQGFFVKANAASTLDLDNSTRVHSGPSFYKDEPDFSNNTLLIKVSGNDITTQTGIRFLEGATTGHDSHLDVIKFLSGKPEVPKLYSITAEEIYAINSLPAFQGNEAISLGFEAGIPGDYQLDFSGIETFNAAVWLEDLKLQQLTPIDGQQTYDFSFEFGDDIHRFNIIFGMAGNTEISEEQISIFSNLNRIYINNPCNNSSVAVYDLLGRTIVAKSIGRGQHTIGIEDAGYYIVRLFNQEVVVSKKVYIR